MERSCGEQGLVGSSPVVWMSDEAKNRQIMMVCTELAKVLALLMQAPAPKGQQVIIHVSKDRRDVWIERPAEIVHIRSD